MLNHIEITAKQHHESFSKNSAITQISNAEDTQDNIMSLLHGSIITADARNRAQFFRYVSLAAAYPVKF